MVRDGVLMPGHPGALGANGMRAALAYRIVQSAEVARHAE
jgi:hypothetical protein